MPLLWAEKGHTSQGDLQLLGIWLRVYQRLPLQHLLRGIQSDRWRERPMKKGKCVVKKCSAKSDKQPLHKHPCKPSALKKGGKKRY